MTWKCEPNKSFLPQAGFSQYFFSHQQEITHTPFCMLRLHPLTLHLSMYTWQLLHCHLHLSTMSLPPYYYTSLDTSTNTPLSSPAPFLYHQHPSILPLPLSPLPLLHKHLPIPIPPVSPPHTPRPSLPPLTPFPPLKHPRTLSPPLPLPSSICHRPEKQHTALFVSLKPAFIPERPLGLQHFRNQFPSI